MKIRYHTLNKRVVIYKENCGYTRVIFQKRIWVLFWVQVDFLLFFRFNYKDMMEKINEHWKIYPSYKNVYRND